MSSRRRGGLGLLLLLMVGGWSSAAAQRRAADSALAAAGATWQRLVAEQRARDEARSRRREEDTLRLGDLRLLVLPEVAVEVRGAAQQAVRVLASRYGAQTAVLTGTPIRVSAEANDRWQLTLLYADGRGTSRGGIPGRLEMTQALIGFAEQAIWERTDGALRAWLPGTRLVEQDTARIVRQAYYELALSGATVARACLLGDLGGCEEALGLEAEADPLGRWYDGAAHRALVLASRWDWSPVQMELLACREDANAAACERLLRRALTTDGRTPAEARAWGNDVFQLPSPVGDHARGVFLDFTLAAGGPATWQRLLADPAAPLAARFAAAGGVSVDSLLRGWRARVVAGRPAPNRVSPALVLTALVWAGGLATLGCWGRR